MTKMTKELREHIVRKALEKAGIPEAKKKIAERRFRWAEAVRIDAVGGKAAAEKLDKANAQVQKIIEGFPESLRSSHGAFRIDSDILLNIGGNRFRAYFGELKPTPYEHVLLAGSKLADEFEQIERDKEEIDDRSEDIALQVRVAIERFSTVKKMVEAWPEVVELLPTDRPESKMHLPAVPVETLNALVGLPSEKPATANKRARK